MSFPDFSIYGEKVFKLRPDRMVQGDLELDRGTIYWQSDRRNTFITGQPPPGYPFMKMVEVSTEEEIENHAYEHSIQCEGILGDLPYKFLPGKENSPHEGFDTFDQPILTINPRDPRWTRGSTLPGFPNMFLVDIGRGQHRARGYYDLTLGYKGLLDGKPAKRRYGTQTFTWSGDKVEYTVGSPVYSGYPAQFIGYHGEPFGERNMEVDQPGASVNDILVSLEPPPTWLVPSFWVPPNAPAIALVPYVASESPRYYWPSGWQCTNVQAEQILDKACWLISITWSTKPQSTPGGQSSTIIRL